MQDIMVDIETTGTMPDRHAILQIAAVRFDLDTMDVDTNTFDKCLRILPTRSWDEDTRQWWGTQKQTVLQEIYGRMEPAGTVMRDFAEWVGYGTPARFWSKPLSFDFMFIASYFRDCEVHNPFDFRMAMDCRSYLRGLAHPHEFISEKSIEFIGDAHNALFDTFHQVRWLFTNQEKFGGTVVESNAS